MPESILIATLGAEPQVVTLTLDALLARGEVINLVEVVHTDASQSPIFDALKALETVFVVEKFYGQSIRYQPISLRGVGGALQDLTSAAEIEIAFHALYSLLRDHKHRHHRIHLCIAGGRKTTTVFAMAAAKAVLDGEDRVWHLVSEEQVVKSRAMHAPQGDVVLVEVPFLDAPAYDQQKVRVFLEHILTASERQVVELLVREGLGNAQLAQRLVKSQSTVANQLTAIYQKLQDYFQLRTAPDRAMLLVVLGKHML